jgi:hypothetical protein
MHAYPTSVTNFDPADKITADQIFEEYFSNDFASHRYAMGTGGVYAKTAISFASFYMYDTTGPAYAGQQPTNPNEAGWNYQPEPKFVAMLDAAVKANPPRPIVIHFNGTRWMNPEDTTPCDRSPANKSLWCAFATNPQLNQLQVDQFEQPFIGLRGAGACKVGECFLSIARGGELNNPYGTLYRQYKARNLREAINYVLQKTHGKQNLIAITLDSETAMGAIDRGGNSFPRIGDYGSLMLSQFHAYLPVNPQRDYTDFSDFKQKYGWCMSAGTGWNEVIPPKPPDTVQLFDFNNLNPCWRLWQGFREIVVQQMVADTAAWANQVGIPAARIFTHQGVGSNPATTLFGATPISTALAPYSNVGIDLYYELLYNRDTNQINVTAMNEARTFDRGWGLPEFSPGLGPNSNNGRLDNPTQWCSSDVYNRTYNALEAAHQRGAHLIAPYLWNPLPNTQSLAEYSIGNCPDALNAYRSFLRDLAPLPVSNHVGDTQYETIRWNFWPSGDTDGWSYGSNIQDWTVSNGTFAGTTTNEDAQIYFNPSEVEEQVLPLPGSGMDYVLTVRMNLTRTTGNPTTPDYLEVFWQTEQNPSWSSQMYANTPVHTGDGEYKIIIEDRSSNMGIHGRITKLRIDPTYIPNTRVTIESIELKPRLKFWWFGPSNDLEGWTFANGFTNVNANDGAWTGTLTGADPFIRYEAVLGHLALPGDNLHLSMAFNRETPIAPKGRIFWITTADQTWSMSKSLEFSLHRGSIGVEGWDVYDIPVGTSPEWYGTIQQILIKPISDGSASSYSGATFKMDNLILYNPYTNP